MSLGLGGEGGYLPHPNSSSTSRPSTPEEKMKKKTDPLRKKGGERGQTQTPNLFLVWDGGGGAKGEKGTTTPPLPNSTASMLSILCCVCTHRGVLLMHSFARQRGSLSHDVSHLNRTTTSTMDTKLCPDRRKETCLHISSCACHPQLIKPLKTSLGSCHPSVAACPLAQATSDPAIHTIGAVPARAVTRPFPASVSCPCIRGSVLSCSASGSKPALLVLWPSACKAQSVTCKSHASGGGSEVQCYPLLP